MKQACSRGQLLSCWAPQPGWARHSVVLPHLQETSGYSRAVTSMEELEQAPKTGHDGLEGVCSEDEMWEKMRVPGHVVFRFKGDEVFWLRVAELLDVDLEAGTAEFWHHLRSRRHSTKKWDEPLVLSPHHPEYYSERNPSISHIKPKKEKLPGLRRRQGQVDKSDVELVVPHFMLESGGKVPRKVCVKVDEYLRRQIKAGASGALVSLSYPTEKEE